MPAGHASNGSPPTPRMPTLPKLRRGMQTDVTSASGTPSPLPPPMKKITYEPLKEERVEENDDDDE